MKIFSTLRPGLLVLFLMLVSSGCQRSDSAAENVNRAAEPPPPAGSNSNGVSPDEYCETVYAKFLEENEQDYVSCLSDVKVDRQCPKPDGFDEGVRDALNVVIALDASGSMNGKVSGRQKLEVAKDAITAFVGTLPADANVGLIVYGHRGSNSESQKQISCAGVEPVYPVRKLEKTDFLRVVNSFEPTGWTPLAGAIDKAGEVLNGEGGERATNLVYVVSDGIETCGGNPVEAARALHASDVKAIVNIIGFDVDTAAQKQLKDAAAAGGGQYSDARSAAELAKVFGGVARSVAEYNEYLRCLKNAKQDVYNMYRTKETKIFSCVFDKVQTESSAWFKTRQNWSRTRDPRDKCSASISQRQAAREKRIRDWRDDFLKKMERERKLTYDELERELKSATEKTNNLQ